jgi:hypothetical protein
MTDDDIIGIDGRQPVELRADKAAREKREDILSQKLTCLEFELRSGKSARSRPGARRTKNGGDCSSAAWLHLGINFADRRC